MNQDAEVRNGFRDDSRARQRRVWVGFWWVLALGLPVRSHNAGYHQLSGCIGRRPLLLMYGIGKFFGILRTHKPRIGIGLEA
ncbi:hypothetical protein M3J09_011978 [Ascochyta lentis]